MSQTRRIRALKESSQRIAGQITSLVTMASDRALLDMRSPSVSDWSVGEQIEHLRRSDLTILKALSTLDANGSSDGSPNLVGRFVLLSGLIPRGRGRAPAATTPLEVNAETLLRELEDVRQSFAGLLPDLDRLGRLRAKIKHPVLGRFTAAQMLSFTAIHHHHHLKIIRDIRRSAA